MDVKDHHFNYFIGYGLKWCHHDSFGVEKRCYNGETFDISITRQTCEVRLKYFFFNKLLCNWV